MKSTLLAFLLSFSLQSFAFEATLNDFVRGCTSDDYTGECAFSTSSGITATTLVGASSDDLGVLKEEIYQVQPDALNFLAGEEMTLALEEVIAKIRNESPLYHSLSDTELAAFIISN